MFVKRVKAFHFPSASCARRKKPRPSAAGFVMLKVKAPCTPSMACEPDNLNGEGALIVWLSILKSRRLEYSSRDFPSTTSERNPRIFSRPDSVL
jgi:hypothetical protein